MLLQFSVFGFGILLLASSCRTSTPPAVDVCIGDGFGGADCALIPDSPLVPVCQSQPCPSGSTATNCYYCPPTALKDSWITTQASESAFASWCYDAPQGTVNASMANLSAKIKP